MLFTKWTFSLFCLVALLAFGFVMVVPTAMADHDTKKFATKLAADETTVDISTAPHIQILDRANATDVTIVLAIRFDRAVQLDLGTGDDQDTKDRPDVFELADIIVDAYDKDGRPLGLATLAGLNVIHRTGNFAAAGQEFTISVTKAQVGQAIFEAGDTDQTFDIHSLLFSIPKDKVTEAGIEEVAKFRADPKHEHSLQKNARSNVLRIELVDSDTGNARYSRINGNTATAVGSEALAGVPGVISVTKVIGPSGFSGVETGAFDVRIILTEEPKEFKKDHIMVANGSASDPVKGLPIKGNVNSEGNRVTNTATSSGDLTKANAGGGYGDAAILPDTTGRDNMYYQYRVTITPNQGHNGDVVVSVKQFEDMVLPISKKYIPLTDGQIKAISLTGEALTARDARITAGREMLTVKVNTAADTTSKVAVATTAYKDRQEKVFDKMANEIVLGNKLVVPAGGYLVLVADKGKAGIQDSPAKLKDKNTAAKKLYNITGLGLPFPADDLANFFRNGGTLNLSYKDIPEATGSDHGDSKGATGDDATGYDKANSTPYADGALIINEIMWGLNGGADPATGSQYIELYNPGTADIGIDNKEWIITVGNAPDGFTVIDSAGNNPASGFWEVPGASGVTSASASHPVVSDLVSMSRVTSSGDGTAKASWAMSIRPGDVVGADYMKVVGTPGAANLSGRRIGTPGAANNYKVEKPKTTTTTTTTTVVTPPKGPDPAGATDIAISEIMYSVGRGNLPQWIELHNMSAKEVSLEGWNVEIENDGADDLTITLGAITVGVAEKGKMGGQAVLLVSKNGRNSGMGADGPDGEGELRASRVVNLKDLGVTLEAGEHLLSLTGFKITLVPPAADGSSVRKDGDVVGGMDWDLAMMDGDRSSLVRAKNADGSYKDGTMRMSWDHTNSTGRYGTYYGHPSDMGTPGYVKGGALPVELSMFYPARDRLTGAVVIKWETQSELNNAGFFIKRSTTHKGPFTVINPTMIAGAGTTSEKQSYTYSDTTAKPNIVYYYQIEDVSLDGKRATLTRAHRLKGHIGAAGKATTIWGELKTVE